MKTTMLVLGTLATVAMAQDLPGFESLPACGKVCVTNMVGQAPTLKCGSSDLACLCLNSDFSYGIRDCTNESCPSDKDAQDTQSWGVGICANQGVAVTSASRLLAASTASGSTVSTKAATATGLLSVTSSVTTTITSGGTVFTTVVPTIVPLLAASSSAATKSTESTNSTGTSTGVTRTSTATSQTTDESAPSTGNSSSGETGTPGAAPRATAVPMGIMAAAGLAAFLI